MKTEDKTIFENILMKVKDQIAWIAVNRPLALNALNHQKMDELGEVFNRAREGDGVRVLILTSAGENPS